MLTFFFVSNGGALSPVCKWGVGGKQTVIHPDGESRGQGTERRGCFSQGGRGWLEEERRDNDGGTEDEGEGILVEEDYGGDELLSLVSVVEMAALTKDKNRPFSGLLDEFAV